MKLQLKTPAPGLYQYMDLDAVLKDVLGGTGGLIYEAWAYNAAQRARYYLGRLDEAGQDQLLAALKRQDRVISESARDKEALVRLENEARAAQREAREALHEDLEP